MRLSRGCLCWWAFDDDRMEVLREPCADVIGLISRAAFFRRRRLLTFHPSFLPLSAESTTTVTISTITWKEVKKLLNSCNSKAALIAGRVQVSSCCYMRRLLCVVQAKELQQSQKERKKAENENPPSKRSKPESFSYSAPASPLWLAVCLSFHRLIISSSLPCPVLVISLSSSTSQTPRKRRPCLGEEETSSRAGLRWLQVHHQDFSGLSRTKYALPYLGSIFHFPG